MSFLKQNPYLVIGIAVFPITYVALSTNPLWATCLMFVSVTVAAITFSWHIRLHYGLPTPPFPVIFVADIGILIVTLISANPDPHANSWANLALLIVIYTHIYGIAKNLQLHRALTNPMETLRTINFRKAQANPLFALRIFHSWVEQLPTEATGSYRFHFALTLIAKQAIIHHPEVTQFLTDHGLSREKVSMYLHQAALYAQKLAETNLGQTRNLIGLSLNTDDLVRGQIVDIITNLPKSPELDFQARHTLMWLGSFWLLLIHNDITDNSEVNVKDHLWKSLSSLLNQIISQSYHIAVEYINGNLPILDDPEPSDTP